METSDEVVHGETRTASRPARYRALRSRRPCCPYYPCQLLPGATVFCMCPCPHTKGFSQLLNKLYNYSALGGRTRTKRRKQMGLEEDFKAAADLAASGANDGLKKISQDQQLKLYGWFKQVERGRHTSGFQRSTPSRPPTRMRSLPQPGLSRCSVGMCRQTLETAIRPSPGCWTFPARPSGEHGTR